MSITTKKVAAMKTEVLPATKGLTAEYKKHLMQALGVVIGVALMIVSAKIQIPFWPVPLTMQSAVAVMLPCLLGWRSGVMSVVIYLGLGAAGYPVFAHAANMAAGPAYFMGPTGGYLIGFVLAALCVGGVHDRFQPRTFTELAFLMLAGHVLILASGFVWLAYGAPSLGFEKAMALGVVPFLLGSAVKSVFAALCVQGVTQRRPAA